MIDIEEIRGYTPTYGTTFISDIGDALGIGAQRRQQEFNSAEAQKQRDWEEYMSNTAYQRAMDDISQAGLNPALVYSQGGATTPVGNSASSGIQNNTLYATAALIGNTAKLINEASKKASAAKTATKIIKIFS